MTTGLASGQANAILDALCRSVAYSDPAGFFLKLHLGDPGAAGTSNPAAETARQAVTFSAASGGAITNSADVVWLAVSTTETFSHWSAWSASVAGTFLCSDALNTPKAMDAGDDFTIKAGDLDIDITAIAA